MSLERKSYGGRRNRCKNQSNQLREIATLPSPVCFEALTALDDYGSALRYIRDWRSSVCRSTAALFGFGEHERVRPVTTLTVSKVVRSLDPREA